MNNEERFLRLWTSMYHGQKTVWTQDGVLLFREINHQEKTEYFEANESLVLMLNTPVDYHRHIHHLNGARAYLAAVSMLDTVREAPNTVARRPFSIQLLRWLLDASLPHLAESHHHPDHVRLVAWLDVLVDYRKHVWATEEQNRKLSTNETALNLMRSFSRIPRQPTLDYGVDNMPMPDLARVRALALEQALYAEPPKEPPQWVKDIAAKQTSAQGAEL